MYCLLNYDGLEIVLSEVKMDFEFRDFSMLLEQTMENYSCSRSAGVVVLCCILW